MNTAPIEIADEQVLADVLAAEQLQDARSRFVRERFGGLEEDEIGRRVVEEAREDAGDQKNCGAEVRPSSPPLDLSISSGTCIVMKMPDEQARDLEDRRVVEAVGLAGLARRGREARSHAGEHEQFTEERERRRGPRRGSASLPGPSPPAARPRRARGDSHHRRSGSRRPKDATPGPPRPPVSRRSCPR